MGAEAALAEAHRSLMESAAVSKRAIEAHRRALRNQKEALKELETVAERYGIRLNTDGIDPGGHSR